MPGEPWLVDDMEAPPQVLFVLLGYPVTDFLVFSFFWFGGLVLLWWAVIHEVSGNDGPGAS